MTEAFYFDDTQEFLTHNKEVIHENYFVFFAGIMGMNSPETKQLFQLYNVTDDDGSCAYCLWYSGNYVVHCFKWNDKIINALSQTINFNELSKITFSGNKDLLIELFRRNNVEFELIKERLIYSCSKINVLSNLKGKIEKATIENANELSSMSYQYQLDEYGKHAYRDLKYMSNIVLKGIENGNLYILKVDNQICSMAQVISEEYIAPLIGQLYTKNEQRNKGYATSLLNQLTNKLLSEGHKNCGLLSDVANISSNNVFRKAGYKNVYSQIAVRLD